MRILKKKPTVMDASIEEDIYSMLPHLKDLAWCALEEQKLSGQQVAMFCVELCDRWGDFANSLTNQRPSIMKEAGNLTANERFISGLYDNSICIQGAKAAPDIADQITELPENGTVRLVVFYAHGVMSLDIVPTQTSPAC